jgi:hypothetical protein
MEREALTITRSGRSRPGHDRHGGGLRQREDVAGPKNAVAWQSDPSTAENPSVLKVPRFDLDARNCGDALDLLRAVPTEFTKLVTAQVGQAFFTVEPEIFLDSGISFRFKDS